MAAVANSEDILARLFEVIQTVPGLKASYRNESDIDETKLPLVLMLDGDEEVEDLDWPSNDGSRPVKPTRVTIRPEIYIMVKGTPATVGAALSSFRQALVRRVLNDAQLRSLAVDGNIRYEGVQTGLSLGRSLLGEQGVNISIRYIPDLTPVEAVTA